MSTTEATTSPAQQSLIRWQRVRSQLGLCIVWLVAYVLGAAGAVLLLLLLDRIVLGGADLINVGISGASGLTAVLIFVGLRALWRRGREAEAVD